MGSLSALGALRLRLDGQAASDLGGPYQPHCTARKVSLLRADRSVNGRGTAVGLVVGSGCGNFCRILYPFGQNVGLCVTPEFLRIRLRRGPDCPGDGDSVAGVRSLA